MDQLRQFILLLLMTIGDIFCWNFICWTKFLDQTKQDKLTMSYTLELDLKIHSSISLLIKNAHQLPPSIKPLYHFQTNPSFCKFHLVLINNYFLCV